MGNLAIKNYEIEVDNNYQPPIEFYKLNPTLSITFYNFDRLDQNAEDIIKFAKKVKFKNKTKLIVFPNKKASNDFISKYYGVRTSDNFESRYSFIKDISNNKELILLNFEKIKYRDTKFLLKLLTLKLGITLPPKLINFRIYENLVLRYNSKFNIDFLSTFRGDKDPADNLRDDLFGFYCDHVAIRKLIRTYPEESLNYSLYLLKFFDSEKIENVLSLLPDLIGVFSLIHLYLREGTLLASMNQSPSYNELYQQIKYLDNKIKLPPEYSGLKKSLYKFRYDIYNTLCKNELTLEKYLSLIVKSLYKFIDDLQPVFNRFPEITKLCEEANDIVTEMQFTPTFKMLNTSRALDYLLKTKKIVNKIPNPEMKFMLHNFRFYILHQILLIQRNEEYYDLVLEEGLEVYNLIKKNYRRIKKYLPVRFRFDDVILALSPLIELSFAFNRKEDLNKFLKIYDRLIQHKDITNITRFYYYFSNFYLLEDYKSLMEVYRIIKLLKESDFEGLGEDNLKSEGTFTNAVFEKSYSKKRKLLLNAIRFVENAPIKASTFQRDVTNIRTRNYFYRMYFHLNEANFLESNFLLMSEIENAYKIANQAEKNIFEHDTLRYYILKTKIVYYLLKDDKVSFKKCLDKIKNFDTRSSRKFQKFINDIINLKNKKLEDKIKKLLHIKEEQDIWTLVLLKIWKKDIEKHLFKNYEKIRISLKDQDFSKNLNKFKDIVEHDAISSFYSKNKKILHNNAEDIGRNLLAVFLRSLDLWDISKESLSSLYKTDLIVHLNKDSINILEAKIYRGRKSFDKGLHQIYKRYYLPKKGLYKNIELFYIIFDIRKNPKNISRIVKYKGIKMNCLQILINI